VISGGYEVYAFKGCPAYKNGNKNEEMRKETRRAHVGGSVVDD
jgi:hypothetical protein